MELKALCMKCFHAGGKDKVAGMKTMVNPVVEEKNGRFTATGTCPTCNGKMFKFLSKDDAEKMKA